MKSKSVRGLRILVVNSPHEYQRMLKRFKPGDVDQFPQHDLKYDFALVFATNETFVSYAAAITTFLVPDAAFWIAYERNPSLSNQIGLPHERWWAPLYSLGYERVTDCELDEIWHALRFRKISEPLPS